MNTKDANNSAESNALAVVTEAEVILPGAENTEVPAQASSPAATESVKAETASGGATAETKKVTRKKAAPAVALDPKGTLVKAKAAKRELTSGLQLLECRNVLQNPETFAYTIQFVAKQDESVVFERELEATEDGPELGSDLHRDLETLYGEELTPRKLESLTLDQIIGRKALGVVRLGRGRRRPTVDGLFTADAAKALLTAEGLLEDRRS